MTLFPHWQPTCKSIKVLRDWSSYNRGAASSVNVSIDSRTSEAAASEARAIPQFDFETVHFHSGARDSSGFVANVGGSVSALDWLPSATDRGNFLAVGTHPHDEPTHRVGVPMAGKGAVQIWCTPNVDTAANRFDEQMFSPSSVSMEMALLNARGGVWDVRWCPSALASDSSASGASALPRLGLLALALGDGTVQVLAVPDPRALKQALAAGTLVHEGDAAEGSTTQALGVLLEPVFTGRVGGVNDKTALPWTLAWDPRPPHNRLMAACQDGSVAVWLLDKPRNDCAELAEAYPVHCFMADSLPLRQAQWAPATLGNSSFNVVVTCGHAGNIKFWDLRDAHQPLFHYPITRGYFLSMRWCPHSKALFLTCDDHKVRVIHLMGMHGLLPLRLSRDHSPGSHSAVAPRPILRHCLLIAHQISGPHCMLAPPVTSPARVVQ
ncbi:hypothetical protein CYMTET_5687 [Cymbomonas tetramitiformis]|uniref:Uncharacterized protein n=1 Tax=Cymbomonas tetramitiformis TaxID=36881 RepID=A0AAE0H0K9_9CHLO|nr:hypothetical protein CYMTET_5687 [Cymbomonas tetramitiformis]